MIMLEDELGWGMEEELEGRKLDLT
jgi:hypothetical protein